MTLRSFLEYLEHSKQFPVNGTVFSFFGKEYPLLFFYHLFSFCKNNGMIIERFNCNLSDTVPIKALLSTMSFRGQNIYWLENFHTMSSKKQEDLLGYLQRYNGPHKVILFSQETTLSESLSSNIHIITMPHEITVHDFSLIQFLVTNNNAGNSAETFVRNISIYTDHLSLDGACLLARYQAVLGKNTDDFFANWATRIIEPTSSLFLLSQYLFGKKSKLFFRQWAKMHSLYMPSFWATFWADQMWRAYIFCDLMKQKQYAEAKKAQYKLPFSFINRDWSSYSLSELSDAHQFLYNTDFRLKNGGSDLMLDHFYAQFFENKFRTQSIQLN